MTDKDEIRNALDHIKPQEREIWFRMGGALKTELGEDGFEIWDTWAQKDPEGYNANASKATWKSMKPGRVHIESLYFEARRSGWQPGKEFTPPSPQEKAAQAEQRRLAEQKALEERVQEAAEAKARAQERWDKAKPANPKHPYLVAKGITSAAVIGTLRQDGNQLLVPMRQNKEITMLQAIGPNGFKSFDKGGELVGSAFLIGHPSQATTERGVLVAEGFATAASLHQATGQPVLAAFTAYNLKNVAESLKDKMPDIPVTFCADNDSNGVGIRYAEESAEIMGDRAQAIMPEFTDRDFAEYRQKHGPEAIPSDFNDLAQVRGLDALREIIVDQQQEHQQEKLPAQLGPGQAVGNDSGMPEVPAPSTPTPVSVFGAQEQNRIELDLEQQIVKAPTQAAAELQQGVDQAPDEPRAPETPEATEIALKKSVLDPEQPIITDTPTQVAAEQQQGDDQAPAAPSVQEAPEVPEIALKKPVLDLAYKAPPDGLEVRYLFVDGRYVDADNGVTTIFQDKGKYLATTKQDIQTVHDMVEVAKAKEWDKLKLSGTPEFKRLMYIEAESQGIKTRGYQPTPADLAMVNRRLEERSLNQVQPELEQVQEIVPGQGKDRAVQDSDRMAGILINHGEAPYQNDEKNKDSYFVTLGQGDTERTIWGVGLRTAIEESQAKAGDHISLKNLGQVPVEVKQPVYADDGKTVIGHEYVQTHRNAWTIGVSENELEKSQDSDNAVPEKSNTQAVSAADRLVAQNELPTEALIETSPKADIDSDVRMRDIGSQSIPSEVKIAADQMRASQSTDKGVAVRPGFLGRLNPASQAKFRYLQHMAHQVVSYMRHDRREDAHRNFNTNMEKAVHGTTLNVPEPMKERTPQTIQQEQQKPDRQRDQQQEMTLER